MNKNIIEVVTFKVKKEVSEEQLLKLFHAFGDALKRENEGFIKHSLAKHSEQDEWVELVWWKSMEDSQVALEKMPPTTEFQQYCAALEEEGSSIYYLEQKD